MRRVECLKHCQFVHDGYSDVELVSALSEWYSLCSLDGCVWIIVVITQAAGRGSGKNVDIYKFNPDVKKSDLQDLLAEKTVNEIIFTFNCKRESFEEFINEVVIFRG